MVRWIAGGVVVLCGLAAMVAGSPAKEQGEAQKRILLERGEKVTGKRLALVKRVLESYQGCQVLSEGNEMIGLIIDGKTYQDFTILIRDAKKTIIVATPDGVVTFDY